MLLWIIHTTFSSPEKTAFIVCDMNHTWEKNGSGHGDDNDGNEHEYGLWHHQQLLYREQQSLQIKIMTNIKMQHENP